MFSLNCQAATHSEFIEKTVKAWMQKNHVPGVAVEFYENGKTQSYYFGYANREAKIPITANTIFEIASFTKLFTCLLLAEEVQAGHMKLDGSVSRYLKFLTSNSSFDTITLVNLASYTAGFPFAPPDNIKTAAGLKSYLQSWHPDYPAGTRWTYSNLSIGLLGDLISTFNHQTINELYRTHILEPLGMQAIGIEVPAALKTNYAQGYSHDGKVLPPSSIGLFPAAGSMKASAHDMLLFLKAALTSKDTPLKLSKAMHLTQSIYFSLPESEQGLGWSIYPLADYSPTKLLHPSHEMDIGPLAAKQVKNSYFEANALIDKTGATYGFRSYIALIPKQQKGVVILVNRYVSNGEITKIGRQILLNDIKNLKAK